MMSEDVYRLNCWFEGHVQGVGFRAQTRGVARGYEVTGTVRNLADGRVQLYAEGEESEVEAFREAVESELEDYIRNTETTSDRGRRQCEGFRIVT